MSASRPGSLMLRAATAASGGTGAPLATYCSIWAWTVRISAWTSRPDGLSSSSVSMVARRYGSVAVKPTHAQAPLALDDGADGAVLELDDLGDLGQRADRRRARTASVMSSCSAWRWVTSAIGPPSATAALSALTLFSRPTWSGTIISGKMTVSRSATSGSSRGTVVARSSAALDRGGRSLGHRGSPRVLVPWSRQTWRLGRAGWRAVVGFDARRPSDASMAAVPSA